MNTNDIKVGQTLYILPTYTKCVVVHVEHEGITECAAGLIVKCWHQNITVKVGSKTREISNGELCTKKEAVRDLKYNRKFYAQQLKFMHKSFIQADKQLEKLLNA